MKILSFLSTQRPNATSKEYSPKNAKDFAEYGGVVGIHTNDAPTKFLLEKYKGKVTDILVIVTDSTKGDAFSDFKKMVNEINPKITVTAIPFDENEDLKVKSVPEILKYIQTDDTILIDTTGGFRDAIILLLLISQILTYKDIPIEAVVYSNFHTAKIEQIDDTIDLFKIVTGMQVLISTGNVKKLREYYPKPYRDEKIESVLSSLEKLYNVISLCFVGEIDSALNDFNHALSSCNDVDDVLFSQLISVFRSKYSGQMDLIDLIDWCVDSFMVQQALTIYNEKLPKYLFENKILKYNTVIPPSKIFFLDPHYELFNKKFMKLGSCYNQNSNFREYLKVKENKFQVADCIKSKNNCTISNLDDIYLPAIKNIKEIKHHFIPFDQDTFGKKSRLDKNLQEVFSELCKMERENIEKNNMNNDEYRTSASNLVYNVSSLQTKYLSKITQIPIQDDFVETIKNLEEVLENNNVYSLNCTTEVFATICRDYLYIKSLRNRTNHANDTSSSDEVTIDYLKNYDFLPIEDIREVDMVCDIIRRANQNVRQAKLG